MTPASYRVLVVEDEATLRESVVRGLSRLEGVEVVGAGSVAEALRLLDEREPAVVVSDIDLPDRSGIELLGELGARQMRAHVIFVSAFVKAYKAQIPPRADAEIHEKPLPIEKLRALVRDRLGGPAEVAAPFGIADYLQLAGMGRHSVALEVSGSRGAGRVVVVSGEMWSADDAQGGGLEAFRRLLFDKEASVRVATLRGEPGTRNLVGSCEEVLLDSARAFDEGGSGGQGDLLPELGFEDPPAPPQAPPAESEDERFARLWDEGVKATLERRLADALQAFRAAQALRPTDKGVEANIRRLEQLGAAQPATKGS